MKHKHYDLIMAWATGAKIQYQWQVGGPWHDTPNLFVIWEPDINYRIKPEETDMEICVC